MGDGARHKHVVGRHRGCRRHKVTKRRAHRQPRRGRRLGIERRPQRRPSQIAVRKLGDGLLQAGRQISYSTKDLRTKIEV